MPKDDTEAEQIAELAKFTLELQRTVGDVVNGRLTSFQREAVRDRSRALVYRTRVLIQHLKARSRVQ